MLNIKKKFIIAIVITMSFALCLDIKSREVDLADNENKINSYLSKEDDKNEEDKSQEQYIGFLDIPVIKLKRGFYSITSEYNDVNKNIQVIADDMDKLLILAAHRGNSKVSFFQNLEKLSMGDEIYLNYKHRIYKYKLYYKYYENKDGNLSIKYDNTKDVLVLITCVRELKDKQVIYIAYKF